MQKENHSIEKEQSICNRCGDSTTDLYFHSENQYWCKTCSDMHDEFIVDLWDQEKLNEDNLNASIY